MSKIKLLALVAVLLFAVLVFAACDGGTITTADITTAADTSTADTSTADTTGVKPLDSSTAADTSDNTPVACTHVFGEWETVKEPTCQEQGAKERTCTLCGEKESGTIDVAAHKSEIIPAVEPTCTSTGLTAGEKCSVCGTVLKAQTTIDTAAHTYEDGKCTVCGGDDPDYIPPKFYTVIFKDYDGTTLATLSVKEGEDATAPSAPSREGYEFIGWDTAFTKVTAELTVTALYEKILTEPTFVVSKATASAGETVQLTVSLKNNPGIGSIVLKAIFDESALTLTGVTYNTAIGGQTVPPQSLNSPVNLYWISPFADAEGDFVLATLTFTVNADASAGDYAVTLSYNPDDIYDLSETNLPFEIAAGKVTVQ